MLTVINNDLCFQKVDYRNIKPKTRERKLLKQAIDSSLGDSVDFLDKKGISFNFLKQRITENIHLFLSIKRGNSDSVSYKHVKLTKPIRSLQDAQELVEAGMSVGRSVIGG